MARAAWRVAGFRRDAARNACLWGPLPAAHVPALAAKVRDLEPGDDGCLHPSPARQVRATAGRAAAGPEPRRSVSLLVVSPHQSAEQPVRLELPPRSAEPAPPDGDLWPVANCLGVVAPITTAPLAEHGRAEATRHGSAGDCSLRARGGYNRDRGGVLSPHARSV